MEPTLADGDFVITFSWFRSPRKGQLVVLRHDDLGILVKRVKHQTPQGYWVESDSVHGVDSRTLGIVSPERLLGTVLFVVRRP